ncbi:diiron oxygenase [Glutamicibacter mishrai]|uniref:diiron oxygenase n=1 Tax=Glutamicibacter mishrai TaxID=1775880 RepID=UPI0034C6076D
MCGAVGLFMGCNTSIIDCPLTRIRRSSATEPVGKDVTISDIRYKSAFSSWDSKSSVRSQPNLVGGNEELSGILFPESSIPILSHARLRTSSSGIRHKVSLRHLERYLKFTLVLETDFVNPVILEIARGRDGLRMPSSARQDAYKMYVDEAYHAKFTYDLLLLLEANEKVNSSVLETPSFVTKFNEILRAADDSIHRHLTFLFVIISEMLITGTLNELPRRNDVAAPIRIAIQQHALDEARHHAFFSFYFKEYWKSLPKTHKKLLSLDLPALINCFLEPEIISLHAELTSYGFTTQLANEILSETFMSDRILTDKIRATRPIMNVIRKLGILDDPLVVEDFVAAGLVEVDASVVD